MEDYSNICVITNIGTHYRFPIYNRMADEFSCAFYFGNKVETPIKTFDYNQLKGYKETLANRYFHHFYWQKNSVKLIFKSYKYYILDGEPYCLSSWIILLLAKLLNKKTIAWTHGWYGRESSIKRIIKKVFFSLHNKLMVYNNYAIDLMEKEGISPNKMYCIANSMDSDKEKQLRNTLKRTTIYREHFNNDAPTIIYCGRIQKWKKLEMLVDCVKKLKQEGFLTNCVMVGKDVEDVHIDDYAKSQGVENQIWMYGPCYDDNILGELFYNAHVCVSPGNVGLTAIHSLTFGCPIITHGDFPYQGPEFEAIKPGITGDFFKRNDTDDLKQKMLPWLNINESQRETIRKAAFEEIDQKWNIHYQIDVIKKVIKDLNEHA